MKLILQKVVATVVMLIPTAAAIQLTMWQGMKPTVVDVHIR